MSTYYNKYGIEDLTVDDGDANSYAPNGAVIGTPKNVSNGGATAVQNPSYEALVDQIKQNNAWSAEQAQKQMDFQVNAWKQQMKFNKQEAEANRDFQQQSADTAMNFSAEQAQINRDWQEMMSNTAHQREMADLQAAGLNPILAARSGASTGTGASAEAAQAAGSAAASVSPPSGAKGNTDESGTMAIMSLLSKMLDNSVELQKMQTSAEVALMTADKYTSATQYAAELASIASQYGSDMSYKASQNNLEHILGNAINEFANDKLPSGSIGGLLSNGLDFTVNAAKNAINSVKDFFSSQSHGALHFKKSNDGNGSHMSGKF